MGRSANESWRAKVQSMLDNPHPVVRAEAARAAGELEMTSATGTLLGMLDDPDDDTRLAAIWSLSQIGGSRVREVLERLAEDTEDEEERAFLESALDNLAFTEDMQSLPFFDLPQADEADEELDEDFFEELDDDLGWLDEEDEEDDDDQDYRDSFDDDSDDDEDRLA
jgi:ribonuclease E